MSFFVQPTQEVYEGMVVGENSRADDMDVNITKEKKLTNMRQSTSDTFESMTPPRQLTLEESLEFARDDECVEVTPEIVRIRKVNLDADRARARDRTPEAPGRQRLIAAPAAERRRATDAAIGTLGRRDGRPRVGSSGVTAAHATIRTPRRSACLRGQGLGVALATSAYGVSFGALAVAIRARCLADVRAEPA